MIGCGKQVHQTRAKAIQHVVNLKRNRDDGGELRAYYCINCKGYHVGHQDRMKRKLAKAVAQ